MTLIQLSGEWPDIRDHLRHELDGLVVVTSDAAIVRLGMLPVSDLASCVSAAAAAIVVGISLWQAKRKPEISKELQDSVRTAGVFGVAIESCDGTESKLSVSIRHEVSGRLFQFELSQDPNGARSIRMLSEQ